MICRGNKLTVYLKKFARFNKSVVIVVIFPYVIVSLVVNILFLHRIRRKPDSAIVL